MDRGAVESRLAGAGARVVEILRRVGEQHATGEEPGGGERDESGTERAHGNLAAGWSGKASRHLALAWFEDTGGGRLGIERSGCALERKGYVFTVDRDASS